MQKGLALLALALAGLVSGCDWAQNDANKPVGPGPGPTAGRITDAPSDGGRFLRAASRLPSQASAYAGPESPLPNGAFFDNSRDQSGAARGVVAAWPAAKTQNPAPAVRYTGPERRGTLRSGDVPAPTNWNVTLPRPDPALGASGANSVLAAFDAFQRGVYRNAAQVFSRGAWGAARPRGAPTAQRPNRVTVHHTDGHARADATGGISEMRSIQSFHINGRGWNDVGYHFVVDSAGRVYEGRSAEVLGAHVGADNMNNVGVALMGNYNKEQLSEEQKRSLRRLITFLALRYKSDTTRKSFIMGHMHYMNTDCPGTNVVAFLEQLRRDVDGEAHAIVGSGILPVSFTPLSVVSGR